MSSTIRETQKMNALVQSKWSKVSQQGNADESGLCRNLIPSKYSMEQGMINRKGKLCVPQVPSIKDLVLKNCHDSHTSVKKTLELVRHHY
jgi:uncharacterized protein with NRDE domain